MGWTAIPRCLDRYGPRLGMPSEVVNFIQSSPLVTTLMYPYFGPPCLPRAFPELLPGQSEGLSFYQPLSGAVGHRERSVCDQRARRLQECWQHPRPLRGTSDSVPCTTIAFGGDTRRGLARNSQTLYPQVWRREQQGWSDGGREKRLTAFGPVCRIRWRLGNAVRFSCAHMQAMGCAFRSEGDGVRNTQ